MKKRIFTVLLFYFLVQGILFSQIVLERTNGPYGGLVDQLVINNDGYLFSSLKNDGIYISKNNGKDWTLVYNKFPYDVLSIAVNSKGVIFAGIKNKGIYSSSDNGKTWIKKGLEGSQLYAIKINRYDQIIAGGAISDDYGGVAISSDNGESWKEASSFPKRKNIYDARTIVSCIELDQNGYIYAGTINDGVFRSIDNGVSWYKSNKGIKENRLDIRSIHATKEGRIFLSCYGSIYYSNDYGTSWLKSSDGLDTYPEISNIIEVTKGNLFALSPYNKLYKSTDGGISWSPLDLEMSEINEIFTIKPHEFLYISSLNDGLYRSSNDGLGWIDLNRGLKSSWIKSLEISQNGTIYTSNGKLFRSIDNGLNWEKLNNQNTLWDECEIIAINSNEEVFIETSNKGSVPVKKYYKSVDNFKNWKKINIYDVIRKMVVDSKDNLFVLEMFTSNILFSSDDGLSWNSINDDKTILYPLSIAINTNDELFVSTYNNSIFKSVNRGINWVQIKEGQLENGESKLYINKNNDIFLLDNREGLYRSINNGVTWELVNSEGFIKDADDMVFDSLNIIYIISSSFYSGVRVYWSMDNGATWNKIDDEISKCVSFNLIINKDSQIFLGTNGQGIYKSKMIKE